jgi:hypothetical protein
MKKVAELSLCHPMRKGSPRKPYPDDLHKALGNPPANAGSSHHGRESQGTSTLFCRTLLDAANGKKFHPTLGIKAT